MSGRPSTEPSVWLARALPASPAARGYVAWAVVAIGGAVTISGLSPEALTRLGVLGFGLVQLALRRPAVAAIRRLPRRARFVAAGTALAAVVEGLHMISKPVFPALVVRPGDPLAAALAAYAIDLAFTVPAYLVILAVMEAFARRFRYGPWEYAGVMGLGQVLGDGGIFYFAAAPAMLAFLPYPMTNYHAMNVLPYLAIVPELDPGRPRPWLRFAAIPALVLTYLACGAAIRVVGQAVGFEPG